MTLTDFKLKQETLAGPDTTLSTVIVFVLKTKEKGREAELKQTETFM